MKASENLKNYIDDLWDYGYIERYMIPKDMLTKLKGLIILDNMPYFMDVLSDKLFWEQKMIVMMSNLMIAKDNVKPVFEKLLISFWEELLSNISGCNFESLIDNLFDEKEIDSRSPSQQHRIDIENDALHSEFTRAIF